jgi:hypothetical protein
VSSLRLNVDAQARSGKDTGNVCREKHKKALGHVRPIVIDSIPLSRCEVKETAGSRRLKLFVGG